MTRSEQDWLTRNSTVRALAFCGLVGVAMLPIAGCPGLLTGPTVTAPADQTVECDGGSNQAALNAWLNSATFTEGCGGAMLSNDFQALDQSCGTVLVTWTATDACGDSASDSASFTIVDTIDPTLTVPEPITVTCGGSETADALMAWLASATATDTCGDVTITTERSATPGNCTATIAWTATDDCGNAVSLSSTYTTTGDATVPTMILNSDDEITIECGDEFQDPGVTVRDDCDALIVATVTGEVDLHVPDTYVLTYAAVDACGNAGGILTRTVTVVDTMPPVVVVNTPRELWPPNHQIETLTLADLVIVEDACEGELDANEVGTILDIYSDEPDNDTGDGNTTGDIVIVDDHTFSVRVERQGSGNGRVYGIRFEVSDSSGNIAETTALVHVPHDQSGRTVVDDGAAEGQVVTR